MSKKVSDKKSDIKIKDLDNTIMRTISNEVDNKKPVKYVEKEDIKEIKKTNVYKHPIVDSFSVITLLFSLVSFIAIMFYTNSDIYSFVMSFLLMLFVIVFVFFAIKVNKKSKGLVMAGNILLILYFSINLLNSFGTIKTKVVSNNRMINLSGKSISYAIDFASRNNITLKQQYTYSEIIKENNVVTQDLEEGKSLKGVKVINVEVSEGVDPNKEVIIPDFSHMELDDVVAFVKKNSLSFVIFEFEQAEEKENTVISQSKKGTIKRNEELKIVVCSNVIDGQEYILDDLVNKSKFDADIYLKKHRMKIQYVEDYSDTIKKGYVISQSIKAKTKIKTGDSIVITISKGYKLVVPNFVGVSIKDVTKWIVKNHIRLEVSDKYDDSILENKVISSSHSKGMTISAGDTLKVVVSRGKLKLPNLKNKDEFMEWANKYGVPYDEVREFSDTVKIGEIIKYSHNPGDIIKNGDALKVYISDGKAVEVPNVLGMSKAKATNIIKNAGFGVAYAYSSSNSVVEGNVIRQSPSASSTVSSNITVTIVVSTGKPKPSNNYKPNNNTNNNSTPPQPPTPVCDKSYDNKLFRPQFGSTYNDTVELIKKANAGFKLSFIKVSSCDNGNAAMGAVCNASSIGIMNHCDTYTIYVVG